MAREHDFIFGSSDFIVGQKHFWATSNSEVATSLPEMTVHAIKHRTCYSFLALNNWKVGL